MAKRKQTPAPGATTLPDSPSDTFKSTIDPNGPLPSAPPPELPAQGASATYVGSLRHHRDRADAAHKRGAGWLDQLAIASNGVQDGFSPTDLAGLKLLFAKRDSPQGIGAHDLTQFARYAHRVQKMFDSAGVYIDLHAPDGSKLQHTKRSRAGRNTRGH